MTKALDRALALVIDKKNYIVNPAMMISQENGTTAGTTSGYYPVDQFFMPISTTGSLSVAQVASPTPAGSPNRIRATVASADTSIASGEYALIMQNIEGYRAADLLLGTSSAKTFTLRFGVRAPAGTYCVSFRNASNSRSYVAEYTISAGEANTDVVKTITLSGDQSGTWLTNTSIGIAVIWGLAVGSNYQTASPNVWNGVNYHATSNQLNFMGTVGNVFELFDVGLYEGNTAPDFVVPDYASELRTCQRYWENPWFSGMWLGGGSFSNIYAPCYFLQKRVVPTATLPSSTNVAWNTSGGVTTPSSFTFGISSASSGYIKVDGTGLGGITPFGLKLNARM